MNNSLDSQLKKLRQETQALEQRASHSQSEILAAQQKLKKLDQEIASRTKTLLAKQQEELDLARGEADKALKVVTDGIISGEKRVAELIQQESELAESVYELKDDIEFRTKDLESVHQSIARAELKLKEINRAYNGQSEAMFMRERRISEGEARLKELEESISKTEERKASLESELSSLESDYESKKAEKELQIAKLDAKIVELANALDDRRKEESQTRNDLAIWKKALDEQDRNLRVRELKVAEGDAKLVNNSNLLNL